MFSYLVRRELGYDTSRPLRQAESQRRLWSIDLAEHKVFSSSHDGPVRALDLDLIEHRYLLSGSLDGVVNVFDISSTIRNEKTTFKPLLKLPSEDADVKVGPVVGLQWYTEDTGMFFVLNGEGKLAVYDTNTLTVIKSSVMGKKGHSLHMSPLPDSPYLIAVGSSDYRVPLFDLRNGAALWSLGGHKDEVITVKWSPTNAYLLASGSADTTLRLWDIRKPGSCLRLFDQYKTARTEADKIVNEPPTKKFKNQDPSKELMERAHDGAVNSVEWTPNGLHLVSAGSDNQLRLWDVESGYNEVVNFPGIHRNAQKYRKQFAVSTDSNLLFFPNGKKIGVYQIKTGKIVFNLSEDISPATSLLFHPTLTELYSGCQDGSVSVWNSDHLDGKLEKNKDGQGDGFESDDWVDSDNDNDTDFF